MKTVTIESGADLYSLAQDHLGDHKLWRYVSLVNETGIFEDLKIGSGIKIPDPKMIGEIASAIGDGDYKSLAQTAIPAIMDLSGIKSAGIPKEAWQLIDWIL